MALLRPLAVALALLGLGCGPAELVRYAVAPDPPRFDGGERVGLEGLRAPVRVTRRGDGLWRVTAADETDALRAVGYLQARDRMGQLDLFRLMARGELAELLGNRTLGGHTALETDLANRFLGFRKGADRLLAATSPAERAALDAFVGGINAWIARGHRSLEHRLLGVTEIRPWTAEDSLAIYQLIMHGLGGNADRELRRLALACEAGLDAMERIWPTDAEFPVFALPEEDLQPGRYAVPPAVDPELAAALPALCAQGAADAFDPFGPADAAPATAAPGAPSFGGLAALLPVLREGWSASNNWAVAGRLTASGAALFASDPHLPHMNPPILWGMDVEAGGERVAGFTLPGLHRVVFGHNGRVAWGATTNHVDRQDLVVIRAGEQVRDGRAVAGYETETGFVPFEWRTETFRVRGGESVRATVRFTRDGPVWNDLDPEARGRVPLVALRTVPPGRGRDLDGARALTRAHSAADVAAGLAQIDLGCSAWLFADAAGHIGLRSPCLVPRREGWRGTFPVPGWSGRHAWRGLLPKEALPASDDPARGWLATANGQVVPSSRFPTPYNNDASAPSRYLRITAGIARAAGNGGLTVAASEALQLDAGQAHWPAFRDATAAEWCAPGAAASEVERARRVLCDWDGRMGADGEEATLYTLFTHAVLDRALADELPGESGAAVWRYVQSLLQFEANVAWLWTRAPDAPVWDDVRTPARETRGDVLEAALADAAAEARRRFGDAPEDRTWGRVRPFVLRHLFASQDGWLGRLLNSEPLAVPGGNETVFKQQFPRADRAHMRAAVGPPVRMVVDLADPWAATFSFAGGESGWPRSERYGNLLRDWAAGRSRPLTPGPDPGDVQVELAPAGDVQVELAPAGDVQVELAPAGDVQVELAPAADEPSSARSAATGERSSTRPAAAGG